MANRFTQHVGAALGGGISGLGSESLMRLVYIHVGEDDYHLLYLRRSYLPGGLEGGSRPVSARDLHPCSAAPLTTGNMWQRGQRQVGGRCSVGSGRWEGGAAGAAAGGREITRLRDDGESFKCG